MADSEEISRLAVVLTANIDKYNEMMTKAQRVAHATKESLEKDLGGINVGKAFEKVFDSARLGVLEEGAARLRIFGSALEPLGPIGITAAAGIAAFGLSLERAHKAAEFAESLEKTSEKLGITTTKLQEYNFVALKTGVSQEAFTGAVLRGTEVFGAFISNVGDAKVKDAFKSIGVSKEQARNLATFDNALPVIADKIRAVGNAAEQAKIAEKLGLTEMLPALRMGGAYIKGMEEEAHRLGLVLDAGAVHAAAELAGQIKVAGDQVHTNLMRAFIALTPIVLAITNLIAKMAQHAADTAEELRGLRPFDNPDPTNFSKDHLQRLAVTTKQQLEHAGVQVIGDGGTIGPDGIARNAGGIAAFENPSITTYNKLRKHYSEIGAAYRDRLSDEKKYADAVVPPAKALIPEAGKKPKKGPNDNSAELGTEVEKSLDEAAKNYAASMAALTNDVDAHAAFEKKVVADEYNAKREEIDGQEARIRDDKGIGAAKKKALIAELEVAKATEALTVLAKQELIDRKAAELKRQNALEIETTIAQAQIDGLQAADALAKSSGQRRDIALRIFALEEQIEEAKLEEVITSKESTETQKKIAQIQLDALQATEGQRRQGVINQTAGPLETYTKGLQDKLGPGLGDSLQGVAVKGLETLNTGLTNAIVNSKNLGEAFANTARSIETDLVNMAIEKYLTLPLAQALGLTSGGSGFGGGLLGLFGLGGGGGGGSGIVSAAGAFDPTELIAGFAANGTNDATAGPWVVGENGPEIVNLPGHSQVVPNNLLGSLGGVRSGMAISAPVFNIDNRGAVMTAELIDQMNGLADQARQRATLDGAQLGVAAARKLIPQEMGRRNSLAIA